MALNSDNITAPSFIPLNSFMTTREAAKYLNMSYWHFMRLVENEKIPGIRIADRWIFHQPDLDAYRKSTKTGETISLAEKALELLGQTLTQRQRDICAALVEGKRPSEIARQQQQTRQAIHAQLASIREKVEQLSWKHPNVSEILHESFTQTGSQKGTKFAFVPIVD